MVAKEFSYLISDEVFAKEKLIVFQALECGILCFKYRQKNLSLGERYKRLTSHQPSQNRPLFFPAKAGLELAPS